MTLKTRRRTYWILFGISVAMSLAGAIFAVLLAASKSVPIFLIERGIYAVHPFLKLRPTSLTLSIVDALALSFFAAAAGAFILRTFRKTVSAEIFFFALWLTTLSFESLRLVHLFLAARGASDLALALIDKSYLCARILGFILIFVSGLYASGMRNERHFSILAICAGIAIALISSLPVNTGIWEWNLMFKVGYGNLIEGFSMAIIFITIIDYLIAVRVRGDKSYYLTALGIAMVMWGAHFASLDWSPLLSLSSLAVMSAGCVLYIWKLHTFYLWQ
ncbi:hypothetical protein LWX53_03000 [bacterium]|nr:hypothetical protein [bacterium]